MHALQVCKQTINPIDLGAGTGAWFTQLNMQYKNDNARLCEDTVILLQIVMVSLGLIL